MIQAWQLRSYALWIFLSEVVERYIERLGKYCCNPSLLNRIRLNSNAIIMKTSFSTFFFFTLAVQEILPNHFARR